MKVTVLIPVYNGAPYLVQSVDSVLRQDFGDFEVLLIDDCSKDESAKVIAQCAARDARIRPIYHTVNLGLAGTLNEGLELAKGEYVARLDQDDEALPDRLSQQISFLDAHPEVLVVGGQARNMGATPALDRPVRLLTSPAEIRSQLPKHNCLYHPAVMLRREKVIAAGGYRKEFRNAEDYDLWLRLSRRGDLANLDREVIRYRLTTTGMSYGSRWEQLRYVFLAQASHEKPGAALDELRPEVDAKLANYDRKYFFECVAKHGVRELIELGFPKEARRMFEGFASELAQGCQDELRQDLDRAEAKPSDTFAKPVATKTSVSTAAQQFYKRFLGFLKRD